MMVVTKMGIVIVIKICDEASVGRASSDELGGADVSHLPIHLLFL